MSGWLAAELSLSKASAILPFGPAVISADLGI